MRPNLRIVVFSIATNEHIWSIENPEGNRQGRPQVRFDINVWAGILKNIILGPFNG